MSRVFYRQIVFAIANRRLANAEMGPAARRLLCQRPLAVIEQEEVLRGHG